MHVKVVLTIKLIRKNCAWLYPGILRKRPLPHIGKIWSTKNYILIYLYLFRLVGPVSSFGRVQVVGPRGPRICPRAGRRRVPHVQLKSEMLRLRGAEVDRRVLRIYTNKNVCAWKGERKKNKIKKTYSGYPDFASFDHIFHQKFSFSSLGKFWPKKSEYMFLFAIGNGAFIRPLIIGK